MSKIGAHEVQGNLRGVIIFVSYLMICASLTALILHDILRQCSKQMKKKKTRQEPYTKREDDYQRRLDHRVQLFSALAILSLGVTWFYMFSFFSLSYRTWAIQNDIALPQSLPEAFSTESEATLRLGPWLKDVKLFRDAWEVVLETSPRLFWSQPIFFITTAWSILLGVETHRRRIPHSWAYMLLGQIVAISFAQNLFFLAVLLFPQTETSDKRGASPSQSSKSLYWTPKRSLYSVCVLLTFVSVSLIPWVTGTSWFLKVLIIPHFVLILPSVMPNFCPASWGVHHHSLASANKYLLGLYQLIDVLLINSQFRVGLELTFFSDTNPEASRIHRHSVAMPKASHPPYFNQSPWGLLAAALYEHPAVSSVGWDALLCSLSFICWQASSMGYQVAA